MCTCTPSSRTPWCENCRVNGDGSGVPTLVGFDPVNRPKHYNNSDAKCSECAAPIECIDITRHMHFSIGNAVKYLWRFRDKGGIEDLKKARWYLDDHIKHLESKEPTIHRVYEGERIWEPRLDYALPAGHWRCAVKNFEDDSTQLQQFFFIENVNTLLDGIKQFMPNLGWTDFKIVWIERIK